MLGRSTVPRELRTEITMRDVLHFYLVRFRTNRYVRSPEYKRRRAEIAREIEAGHG